jgi:hypothetical protein
VHARGEPGVVVHLALLQAGLERGPFLGEEAADLPLQRAHDGRARGGPQAPPLLVALPCFFRPVPVAAGLRAPHRHGLARHPENNADTGGRGEQGPGVLGHLRFAPDRAIHIGPEFALRLVDVILDTPLEAFDPCP